MVVALKDRLARILVEKNALSQEKLDEALKIHAQSKESIGDILVKLHYISSDNLLEVLSAELNIPAIHLKRYKIDPEVLKAGDAEMVQDLVIAAVNQGIRAAQEMMADEMKKVTGGLKIPGLNV